MPNLFQIRRMRGINMPNCMLCIIVERVVEVLDATISSLGTEDAELCPHVLGVTTLEIIAQLNDSFFFNRLVWPVR